MKTIFYSFAVSAILTSCSPVGDTIVKAVPAGQLVQTAEKIDLKKGDVLVIWTKFDGSFLSNDQLPDNELFYNLSLNGETVSNGRTAINLDSNHKINSTHETIKQEQEKDEEEEEEKDSDTENSTDEPIEIEVKKTDWSFEEEVAEIPIQKDGKYTLDYKIAATNPDDFHEKVSVILRKK